MKTVTLIFLILSLLIGVFNLGCAVYYKGFKPIVSAVWEFPTGENTFIVFATLEGKHEKEAFKDNDYHPCFSFRTSWYNNRSSFLATNDILVDSVQLRYNDNGIIALGSNVFSEQKDLERDCFEVCFGDFIVPPETDTLWLTLYIRVLYHDSLMPFTRTWSMYRNDWIVHTLHND